MQKTYIFLIKPWSIPNVKHEFLPGLFTWLVLSRKLDFFTNEYTYLLFKVNNNSEEYCKNRAELILRKSRFEYLIPISVEVASCSCE